MGTQLIRWMDTAQGCNFPLSWNVSCCNTKETTNRCRLRKESSWTKSVVPCSPSLPPSIPPYLPPSLPRIPVNSHLPHFSQTPLKADSCKSQCTQSKHTQTSPHFTSPTRIAEHGSVYRRDNRERVGGRLCWGSPLLSEVIEPRGTRIESRSIRLHRRIA